MVEKVAGREFWMHLRKFITEIGLESSKEDPDVLVQGIQAQELRQII